MQVSRSAMVVILSLSVAAAAAPVQATAASGHRPAVTGVSPHSGKTTGGTRVTVSGTNFTHVQTVKFGTAKGRSLKAVSSTKLRVTTPPHAAGLVDVVVVTTHGTSKAVAADRFRFKVVLQAVQVSAGYDSACAVTTLGAVKCWGDNYNGQLGNGKAGRSEGSDVRSPTPVNVVGLSSGVKSVTVGNEFACAVTTAGAVKCWGDNTLGKLGDGKGTPDGSEEYSATPVDVVGLSSGVSSVALGVASGDTAACAVLDGGEVKCWGSNDANLLGDGGDERTSPVPVSVVGLPEAATSVAVGGRLDACATTTGGAVYCWGNFFGPPAPPTIVDGLESGQRVVSMGGAASSDLVCVLSMDGGVQCMGDNHWGALGNGTTDPADGPVGVSGLDSDVAEVSSGTNAVCARDANNGVACWGRNDFGQLGNGSGGGFSDYASTPVGVVGLSSGSRSVSASSDFACAVTASRSVECWGSNVRGVLGNSTLSYSVTPLRIPRF